MKKPKQTYFLNIEQTNKMSSESKGKQVIGNYLKVWLDINLSGG